MTYEDDPGTQHKLKLQFPIEVVLRVLKNIFSRAVEWKLLKENPVATIKKPRVKHKEVRSYDEPEMKLLLIALQQAPIH